MTDSTGDPFRADSWDTYIGQAAMKERLDIHINAAVQDKRYLDHVLLTGPPGAGKTTLANIIAKRLRDPILELVMPIRPANFAMELRQWEGGILFLDEIHRLSKMQQEDLLSLLTDGVYQTASGTRFEFEYITVIAATTEPEKITPALLDRFPIRPAFVDYTDTEMAAIVSGMAERIQIPFSADLAMALGRATGGIPRAGRQFVLAARDIHQAGRPVTAEAVLELTSVDPDGLSADHMRYLHQMAELGGQAGIVMLASMLRLHPSVVQGLERLLVRRKLIMFGGKGRELTSQGWQKVRGRSAWVPERMAS